LISYSKKKTARLLEKVMKEVGESFQSALRDALDVDGEFHQVTFASLPDPTKDRITVRVNMLLIEHKRGFAPGKNLSYVAAEDIITAVFFKDEVPEDAIINANTFLGIDSVMYKVKSSESEYEIFTVELTTLKTGFR
jgi:hypothetical protein